MMAKPAGERPWSNTAWDVKMRSHYKTHCFNVYGGEHWLRFLLVLGDVPEQAVDATNEVLHERVMERRGVDLCLDAGSRKPDPEWHWHQREGRPQRPEGPSAKTLRLQARKLAMDLAADRRAAEEHWGELPARLQPSQLEMRAARVQALLDEADRVSEARRFLIGICRGFVVLVLGFVLRLVFGFLFGVVL